MLKVIFFCKFLVEKIFLCVFSLQGGKKMEVKSYARQMLYRAFASGAVDLYLLPRGPWMEIYQRQGSKRELVAQLKMAFGMDLLRHLKFLGHMDIAETRKPQLGAFTYPPSTNEGPLRLRLSSVGNYQGQESLVVRFFYGSRRQQRTLFPLNPEKLATFSQRGLHLFVGPTGSGKTTLMYQLARKKNFQQVITIEDPVEIEEPNFLQLQTNQQIGLTYEALIKVCLRHRPDCLIIGEIRDEETAQMVLRASLTGHVVFATLHAQNYPEVLERLAELGLSKGSSTQVLRNVVFQRVVAIKCPWCGDNPSVACEKPHDGYLAAVGNWENQLRKAYAYGFITENTYRKEQITSTFSP